MTGSLTGLNYNIKRNNSYWHLVVRQKYYVFNRHKLTKHVSTHFLNGKTSLTIVEILRERLAILSKPCKIIADNEFNTAYKWDFLNIENIVFHFTSPNTHTANSDIEHFHLTLNEHIGTTL